MASHRILIVDDDASVLAMLRDHLSQEHEVVAVDSGYEGLSEVMLGEQKADLMITDLNMPGLNGIELIENLPEEMPVIVISAFLDTPEFKRNLSRVRASAVLRKPFSLLELEKAVQEALSE